MSHLTVGDLLNEQDAKIQALTERVRMLEQARDWIDASPERAISYIAKAWPRKPSELINATLKEEK
jgi:hypothetical protein